MEEPEKSDSDDESDKMRKSALDRLENASEDTFLGQVCMFWGWSLPLWIPFNMIAFLEYISFISCNLAFCFRRHIY